MEHHHFDQCLMILNSPGNQILSNLSSEDYSRAIRVLEDAILSTDLAVYFRKRGPFLNIAKPASSVEWSNEENRSLLRAMSMTVCDLSAITKPWEIEKRVADLVSSEFFEQGDMERHELNITPIDIMNREKEDQLPMMQVGFIDSICLPIYEAFADLSKDLKPLLDGVKENKKQWLGLAQTAQETIKNRKNSLRSMSNGGLNNNSFTYNNNNGDEITITSNESTLMSRIVGKFPLDANGITSANSLFSTTYIKPQNGLIPTYKTPTIVSYNSCWKKNDVHHQAMDQ